MEGRRFNVTEMWESDWETVVYERTKLYDEVWSAPVSEVAKRYGISDVALAKVCRKLAVPVPGRGYWARKAAGNPPPRPRLPARREGQPTEIRSQRRRKVDDLHPLEATQCTAVEQERSPELAVSAPETLDRVRPTIRAAAKTLRKAKPDEHGFVSCSETPYLDVLVSPPSIDRALRILDGLVEAFEKRGYLCEVKPPEPDRRDDYGRSAPRPAVMQVRVDDEWIEFGLSEKTMRVPKPPAPPSAVESLRVRLGHRAPPPYDLRASGQLTLSLKNEYAFAARRTWSDTRTQRLEGLLNDFMAELIRVASRRQNTRLEAEREQKRREEEQRKREMAEKRRREEEARVEDLHRRVRQWSTASAVREFVAALREKRTVDQAVAQPWIAWAERHAATLDDAAFSGLPAVPDHGADGED